MIGSMGEQSASHVYVNGYHAGTESEYEVRVSVAELQAALANPEQYGVPGEFRKVSTEHPAVAHLRVYLGMMEDFGHRVTPDGQCTEHGEYECWCALAAQIVRTG